MKTVNRNFKFYLYNTFLNNKCVEVWESDIDYELRPCDSEGNALGGHRVETFFKRFMGNLSVSEKAAELFLLNEDDIHTNEARALKETLEGLCVADLESVGLGE